MTARHPAPINSACTALISSVPHPMGDSNWINCSFLSESLFWPDWWRDPLGSLLQKRRKRFIIYFFICLKDPGRFLCFHQCPWCSSGAAGAVPGMEPPIGAAPLPLQPRCHCWLHTRLLHLEHKIKLHFIQFCSRSPAQKAAVNSSGLVMTTCSTLEIFFKEKIWNLVGLLSISYI